MEPVDDAQARAIILAAYAKTHAGKCLGATVRSGLRTLPFDFGEFDLPVFLSPTEMNVKIDLRSGVRLETLTLPTQDGPGLFQNLHCESGLFVRQAEGGSLWLRVSDRPPNDFVSRLNTAARFTVSEFETKTEGRSQTFTEWRAEVGVANTCYWLDSDSRLRGVSASSRLNFRHGLKVVSMEQITSAIYDKYNFGFAMAEPSASEIGTGMFASAWASTINNVDQGLI